METDLIEPKVANRTGIDFTKHEVIVTEQEGLLIHYLKRPDTIHDCVKFINTNGILAVTGDYGNWIFCREFHPSAEGRVSEGYWLEKLRIASTQEGEEYSVELTRRRILEMLNGGAKEIGWEGRELERVTEYFEACLDLVDDQFGYQHYAYRHQPHFMDGEDVIYCTEPKYWLKAVFDAFEEICNRLKETP